MKSNYKKIYCDFFEYAMNNEEFIPSELSGEQAVDIHHIYPKKMGGRKTFEHKGVTYDIDAIENLITVTRTQHVMCDAGDWTKDKLWDIHQRKMNIIIQISKSKMQ